MEASKRTKDKVEIEVTSLKTSKTTWFASVTTEYKGYRISETEIGHSRKEAIDEATVKIAKKIKEIKIKADSLVVENREIEIW